MVLIVGLVVVFGLAVEGSGFAKHLSILITPSLFLFIVISVKLTDFP